MKSTDVIQPAPLASAIAANGSKDSIPQLQQDAPDAWYCSIENGFPDITMQKMNEGGFPPRGQGANGLFYITSDQKVYLQNGGYITFDEDVSDAIGGYPKGAVLDYVHDDSFDKVISLIDDNTYNFVDNPTYIDDTHWQKLSLASVDNAKFQCAPFSINAGTLSNGNNNTLSYSGSTLTCAPCTITTCDYRTMTDTETRTLDLSTATNRIYVFKSYSTGELSFIEESRFGIGKAIPVNIIPIGDLSIDNGVLSNFSNDHYARSMQSFNPDSSKWRIVLKITTGADVSSIQSLLGSSSSNYDPVVLYINNGKFAFGISYNITQTDASATGSYNVQANTTYYVKLEWTGTQYRLSYSTDGTNFTLDASCNSTTHVYSGAVLIIGVSRASNAMATPFGGTVDLKESYFEIIDNYTFNFTPDYWLDINQTMYQFKKLVDGNWVVDNDRVAIGSVLVSSGTITEVENYDFNLESKWKANFVNLAAATNLPTTLTAVYRIQDYLPHDNCQYEVLIDGSCTTGTTSGNRADLEAHTDIIKLGTCAICFAITRTSNSNISIGSTILPTGRGRALLVPYSALNTGTYYLNLLGYRRLGFTE